MSSDLGRAAAAEAIGTFAFVFAGAAAVCADTYTGGELGLLGVALAHATALAAAIAATSALSGGHLNPAITLAEFVSRSLEPVQAAVYVGAQLGGALIASILLRSTFAADVWGPVRLGAPALGPGVEPGTGILFEAVLTFFVVFVFVRTARRLRAQAAATGAALLAVMLIGGAITGAAVNPARAFGPALAANAWTEQYVYWIGPLLGAAIAAVAHAWLGGDSGAGRRGGAADEPDRPSGSDGATILPLDPGAGDD